MATANDKDIRKWYVLRTFSGHEKKVKQYLESEIERLGFEDKVSDIMIPTETVFEMRSGKKRTREKTFFPGYILLNAVLDNELQHVIAGVPSVVGFLTTGDQPIGNETGDARLRAGLPETWRVGDKTGTCNAHTANDVGIAWPPSGKPVLIAVYLAEATASRDEQNAAIADVARAIANGVG